MNKKYRLLNQRIDNVIREYITKIEDLETRLDNHITYGKDIPKTIDIGGNPLYLAESNDEKLIFYYYGRKNVTISSHLAGDCPFFNKYYVSKEDCVAKKLDEL